MQKLTRTILIFLWLLMEKTIIPFHTRMLEPGSSVHDMSGQLGPVTQTYTVHSSTRPLAEFWYWRALSRTGEGNNIQ